MTQIAVTDRDINDQAEQYGEDAYGFGDRAGWRVGGVVFCVSRKEIVSRPLRSHDREGRTPRPRLKCPSGPETDLSESK